MDTRDNKSVRNPRKGANLLSVITFKWLLGTFLTGYKRELEISDLYSPLDEHSSKLLGDKVSGLWNQELENHRKFKKPPSLVRVLLKCFGRDIILFGLSLTFVELFIKMTRPIILVNLLRYFRGSHSMEMSKAFYWSTALVLGMLLDIAIYHNSFFELGHIGMKIRIACIALVYRKVLKVPIVTSEDNRCTTGQMINLLSNDAGKLDIMMAQAPYVWIAPIHIIIISFLMYREMKAASYGGITITVLFVFIEGFSGKLIHHFSWKLAYLIDERLRLTNQIISGIKVIKMYTWEKPFEYLNDKARKEEVSAIKSNGMTAETNFSYQEYIPRVSVCATVLTYIFLGNYIDAEKVYFVIAYYNVLRFSFYDCFAFGMRSLIEGAVTIERIKIFLLSEEVKTEPLGYKVNFKTEDKISLSFNNVTAKWNSGLRCEALKQVSFKLQSGTLTAVIGQVGAGKTVLFQTILREIPDIQGNITIRGSIAYVCQEPWVFNSSIKQNILFGKPMDRERYDRVIEVCQLKRDFQLLPYGENTLIGEKGINLSGGQCARISLARAVYHEADIYLLDDPLSAVDTRVGKRIFEDCINTFLKGKTILLITHQFQYLKQVDRIIALEQGSVLVDGTYADLLDSGVNLAAMTQVGNEFDELDRDRSATAEEVDIATAGSVEKEVKEGKAKDSVKREIYLEYFKAARSGWLVFLVFAISAVCQVCRSGADGFVSYWVSGGAKTGNFSFAPGDDHSHNWYITLYCFIIVSAVVLSIIQSYSFFHMSMKISRNLHAAMFSSVIKTKMAFFTHNSVGRIMNRFSKDMGIVDTEVPRIFLGITQTSFQTIAIVSIVGTIYPLFCIAAVIIATSTYLLSRFYLKTIRTVKRLDGITRSPVLNHLSTSVRGLTTIRALNAQQLSIAEFNNYLDLNTSASFIFLAGSRAFGVYIDLLCLAFTGTVTYTLVSLSEVISISNAGLAITQCMLLAQTIQMNVRQATDLESMMTSVERILEYAALQAEPHLEKSPGGHAVSEKWPQRGQITFRDVSLIYDRQVKPFLRNLNFTVRPNEMIGIVGRTGAGKSSLINALFRLADIKGEIYIDDVATSHVALRELRSRIGIIPQEPVLFAGTLRANLDPFGVHEDQALWQALEDVQLKAVLRSSGVGLSARVAEGGMNFSVGQRQLICLARAIVRNNRILVLDEATANVDPQTDQLIQKTVRRKFADCTVLIIAHRLHTVMDCSRILVMDDGQVVEFDHPYNLLLQDSGIFYNMVTQLGATAAENLFQIAKLNYLENYEDNCSTCESSQFTI